MKKRKPLYVLSAILLIMLACSNPVEIISSIAKEDQTDSAGSSTTKILFQDDFSSPDSGWDRTSDDFLETDYVNGGYQISINEGNFYGWANPGKVFSDTRIKTDAELVKGDSQSEYGIICRYKDVRNFYAGLISADGFYAILKNKNGEFELVGMQYMQDSPQINQGLSSNKLQFDCIGDTLTLYVNGEILAQVKDSEFVNGDVGLIASAYESPEAIVVFDDFMVYRP